MEKSHPQKIYFNTILEDGADGRVETDLTEQWKPPSNAEVSTEIAQLPYKLPASPGAWRCHRPSEGGAAERPRDSKTEGDEKPGLSECGHLELLVLRSPLHSLQTGDHNSSRRNRDACTPGSNKDRGNVPSLSTSSRILAAR